MRSDRRSPGFNRGALTFSIMLANIMQGLDTTIANVALPHIRGSLSASLDQISWVLTSYIVAAAIMMPLTGWLAGRFGIKIVFVLSVAGFTLASALCGSATILDRTGRLSRAARDLRRRARAVVAGGAAADQSARTARSGDGGVWHRDDPGTDLRPGNRRLADRGLQLALGILYQPPVGMVSAAGMLIFVHDTRHAHREPFDFMGFATLSLAIGALQLMLDRGQLKDWFGSREIWVEATIALSRSTCSRPYRDRVDRSFINRDLLRNLNFIAGTLLMFSVGRS